MLEKDKTRWIKCLLNDRVLKDGGLCIVQAVLLF